MNISLNFILIYFIININCFNSDDKVILRLLEDNPNHIIAKVSIKFLKENLTVPLQFETCKYKLYKKFYEKKEYVTIGVKVFRCSREKGFFIEVR